MAAIVHKAGSDNLLAIPMHNRDVPKGTLHGTLADAELSVDELIRLLKQWEPKQIPPILGLALTSFPTSPAPSL